MQPAERFEPNLQRKGSSHYFRKLRNRQIRNQVAVPVDIGDLSLPEAPAGSQRPIGGDHHRVPDQRTQLGARQPCRQDVRPPAQIYLFRERFARFSSSNTWPRSTVLLWLQRSPKGSLSSPLSGPTNRCPPASTSSARRSVPTPGSTTAKCTVPCGNHFQLWPSRNRAALSPKAGPSWLISTTFDLGAIPAMTPFMTPTKWSRVPKSVNRVMMPLRFTGIVTINIAGRSPVTHGFLL